MQTGTQNCHVLKRKQLGGILIYAKIGCKLSSDQKGQRAMIDILSKAWRELFCKNASCNYRQKDAKADRLKVLTFNSNLVQGPSMPSAQQPTGKATEICGNRGRAMKRLD